MTQHHVTLGSLNEMENSYFHFNNDEVFQTNALPYEWERATAHLTSQLSGIGPFIIATAIFEVYTEIRSTV
jgi:hypothetical protein